jgi:hypothetical protein
MEERRDTSSVLLETDSKPTPSPGCSNNDNFLLHTFRHHNTGNTPRWLPILYRVIKILG